MKRQIRVGIWETNSSSTHSVSVSKVTNFNEHSLDSYLEDDGTFHITPGEFGWEIERYNGPYTKLQYALTMVFMTEVPWEGRNINDETTLKYLYDTDGFQSINSLIMEIVPNCKNVIVDLLDDGDVGYIDHQSCENYESLQDFLDYYDISLFQFIFDYNTILVTDNDNH